MSNREKCYSGTGTSENIHYYYQCVYLLLSILLHYRILYVIWVSKREIYSNQSFYDLFSLDSAFAIIYHCLHLVFSRVFLFFPQFCVPLSNFFGASQVAMRVYYCVLGYCKAVKPIIHIFIAVNRMCCVLYPITYSQNWSSKMRLMFIIIFLAPFLVIWNIIISNSYILFDSRGGFLVAYDRVVQWASLSFMQLTLIIVTVTVTMTTTLITFWKMTTMINRVKASERALCIAAALISFGFLLVAASQGLFSFFREEEWLLSITMYIEIFTWDILIVGSPLSLLLASRQFRGHVFLFRQPRTQRVASINIPLNTSSGERN